MMKVAKSIVENYFKFLSFDSSILGISVASIIPNNISGEELGLVLEYLKKIGVELVYLENHEELVAYRTNLICKMNLYSLCLENNDINLKENIEITDASLDNLSDLQKLAELILVNSRFSKDRFFPKIAAQKIYQKWVLNSLNGQVAKKVLVYKKCGKILGFITLIDNYPVGRVGLVAVDSDAQNRGIGYELLLKVQKILKRMKFPILQIKTQSDNSAACYLYSKKLNASLLEQTFVYHFWLDRS